MGLWVPPTAARELVEGRREFEAELHAKMMQVKGVLDDFNRDLRRIDPYLELVRAGERISPGTPLRPGFYHVIRHNPGAPPTVMTVEGPDGEFAEPSSAIFDMLARADLQNPMVEYRRREREREIEAAGERRRNREREERREELFERVAAATRSQVLMSPDVPWHQNAAGRRGARRR